MQTIDKQISPISADADRRGLTSLIALLLDTFCSQIYNLNPFDVANCDIKHTNTLL